MVRALEPWHLAIISALLVVLFGSKRLPGAARSIGQSLRIFKSELRRASLDTDEHTPAELNADTSEPRT